MTWQEPLAALVVGLAVGYLVWKIRGGKRPSKKGPDVKVSDLKRKSKRARRSS